MLEQRRALARALSLDEADLLEGAPIRTGSAGVLFLYVPLRSAEAVDRATLDVRALLDCFDDPGGAGVRALEQRPRIGGSAQVSYRTVRATDACP